MCQFRIGIENEETPIDLYVNSRLKASKEFEEMVKDMKKAKKQGKSWIFIKEEKVKKKKDKFYAELCLYCGHTGVTTMFEGSFLKDDPLPYVVEQETRNVKYAIEKENQITMCWGPYLVRSEAEAKIIINYALKNIDGAVEETRLVHQGNGATQFERIIRFDNWKAEKIDELISLLKQSGYVPKLDYIADGVTEKDLNKVDPDLLWKTALDFFVKKYSVAETIELVEGCVDRGLLDMYIADKLVKQEQKQS